MADKPKTYKLLRTEEARNGVEGREMKDFSKCILYLLVLLETTIFIIRERIQI